LPETTDGYYRWTRHPPGAIGTPSPRTSPGGCPATSTAQVVTTAFLREGATALDAAQFLQTLTAWTTEATATLPAPSRLLLQALCQIEETDRDSAILDETWAGLWQYLDQPGDAPPLAAAVAPLVAAALIAAELVDPTDPDTVVGYRIHPGIAEAIHAATPQPVTAAVDVALAAFWTAVADWGIEQEQAGQDTGQLVVRAGLAAAHYLLRQNDWHTASSLLEQAHLRDIQSPVTAQAVIPSLRRIAEATSEPEDLTVLAVALFRVDPREAETLLRRAYDQAITSGDYRLAFAIANRLISLLRDQGRLREALTHADQQLEHTRQAGLGSRTQLAGQAQRLQILGLLGHHEQVLTDLPALRNRQAELPDQPADNDDTNPWSIRETILSISFVSAVALERWQQALDLTNEITDIMRRRGASAHSTAFARFNSYTPFLRLGRLGEAEHVLRDCQQVFETVGDLTTLAKVYSARADLEDERGHLQDALTLERTALRLTYVSPEPLSIAVSHHNLATYLVRATGTSAEQRAHRLAAALLDHLTGDTHALTRTLQVLADELRRATDTPDAPAPPTTLSEIIRLVDAGDGIRFGDLVAALCPDRDTADRALVDLLATAATLDQLGATTNWAAPVAALRRMLARRARPRATPRRPR
ncbi:MAG: hypothetical protein ACRDUV_16720, partial [Pseudonocardiaceae bacterium]